MTQFSLPDFDLDAFVRATLAEDLGAGGDITSMATIPADARFGGVMDSRDAIIVAGLPIAERFFRALEPALNTGATHLLLDNMSLDELRQCVALVGGKVPTEASGGVRLDTIRDIGATGVTYVSVGRLTQSAPAADIGLDFALV